QYAALSYCWGSQGAILTTKSTLKDRKIKIYEAQLPKSMQNAFALARSLGLHYIWIDALCIVQDDPGEWKVEAEKMGLVYSNAFLVISATSSPHADGGLFNPRGRILRATLPDISGENRSIHARRVLDHEIITSCRIKPDKSWEKDISKTFPLLSRAWGFQERLLATRIIHFTPHELVWECGESRWCECGALEDSSYPLRNNMLAAIQECRQNRVTETIRPMWREVVKSYSRRSLTFLHDRLPALSGVAQLLSAPNDRYVAGLWRNALPYDLLWRCDQSRLLGYEKHRKPSWSWASVD
ncbi:HET-domain-containing protein, partial [Glonium stellatum]